MTAAGTGLLVGIAPPFVAAGKAQELTISTAVGEIRTVTLSDRTRLTLDTGSAATVRFNRDQRLIRVDRGRVRIAVASDPRPLAIDAGERIDVEAPGTIDVDRGANGALVRGVGDPVVVTIGSTPRHLDHDSSLHVPPGSVERASSDQAALDPDWPAGVLTFRSEPLGSAVARANRYAKSPLILRDPSLAGERISGRYRAGDIAGLAASLAAAFDLDLARAPDGTYLLDRRPAHARP